MLLIGNGRLITRSGAEYYEDGAVATDGRYIVECGDSRSMKAKYPNAEFIDAHGGVIMPGLINTHNHIYSAFARGLSLKGYNPKNFNDILEGMWWRIDRKLTLENDYWSAMAVFVDSVKNGVTTTFDHHASYFEIPNSLDTLADAAKELGLRVSLCYEVSDRDGEEKRMQGILENKRMIDRANADDSDMLKGMMGLHASFTVSDRTIEDCLANGGAEAGFHVHCAEGPSDLEHCLKTYGKRIITRFFDLGVLGPRSLAVHCIHIDEAEMDILSGSDTAVVHNPESNMGNAVGCGPVIEMFKRGVLLGLGTDGYTNDMLESYKVGNIIHKHVLKDPTVAWGEIPSMLFGGNTRIANRYFKAPLGVIEPGAYADIIVTDYDPLTPMNAPDCNSHILFGMNGRSVVTTICNGKVLMKDRQLLTVDEKEVMAKCRESSSELWQRLNA
ncbi:MAG TPA: putative aminohydrolase SsnA [Eubacteriales bacterium]|nr:putative aminohydrolase SsnA [Eubacteriales bacterium]